MGSRKVAWSVVAAVAVVALALSMLVEDTQKVAPPDILEVKSAVALPGRPIIGERLVRPDGTVSLGYYGEVYVAGLTRREVREKLAAYLRRSVPGVGVDDISVSVAVRGPRRPNLVDWATGKVALKQVKYLY